MLTDAHWMRLEPLVEACRPKGKTAPKDLRRTISAIVWRHQNGAKWRAIPADLGPWSRAAQMFIRWARLGVWERLLLLAQERGVQLGMTFLDGTSIRAHQKAAGAARRPTQAVSAPQPHALAILAGNDAVSVVLDLVEPLRAGGCDFGERRDAWGDKAGRTAPAASGSRLPPHTVNLNRRWPAVSL